LDRQAEKGKGNGASLVGEGASPARGRERLARGPPGHEVEIAIPKPRLGPHATGIEVADVTLEQGETRAISLDGGRGDRIHLVGPDALEPCLLQAEVESHRP